MLDESHCIVLISVFSSFALIFFLAFYFLRISGFDIKEELLQGKGYELFPSSETSEKFLDYGVHEINEEDRESFQNYDCNSFIKIYHDVHKFISEFYWKQMIILFVGSLFFGIFVLLVLEEYIGAWYATISFCLGILFCMFFNFILKQIGFTSCCKMLLLATDNSQKPLAFAYYCGFALIAFFLGFTSILLIILMAIYRKIYIIDSPNVKDYEKVFVLLFGGYTLGYSFGCFFFRGSAAIFQGGVNIGAELLCKSDENINSEDQRNPCCLSNCVADNLGTFTSSFLDITCCFLLSLMVSIILISQSKEFVEDSIAFTTKQARFQIFFTSFLNVFIISFLPYGCYVDNFSILTEGYQTSKDPLFNLRKIGIARGWIIFCLLIGFLLEKILDFIFEYFSSHYNQPVSDLIRACENGPCLNLIASKIMIYLTYPTTFIFVSSTIFLTYGILGFQGIGFALLGLISNFIPSLCICTLGALSTNSLKLGKLTKVSQKPIDRVFNISWSSKNYCSHLFAIVYGVMIFGGFATVGALIGFLNNANLIKFQALQIFGSTIGFSLAYCINGIIMSGVQIISRISIIQSKNQILKIYGVREDKIAPNYEDIFDECNLNSTKLIVFPIFLNIIVLYLSGMLFGSEFLVACMLGFLMASSFIVFEAFVSGNALFNSKILIENTERIPKEGSIYASVSIAELYSLSFKDSSPVLITFICFNAAFALLGANYFDNSGYISAAVGLR